MARRVRLDRKFALGLLCSVATLALCAMQFGDRAGLNSMPYAQVQALVPDLGRAQALAKQGNIEFLGGQDVAGKEERLRGEFTDANCYLGSHNHAYDHAFCAKLCVAAGSPLLFVSDQQSKVYVVLTAKNGVPLPRSVMDLIGVPGVLAKGRVLENAALPAFAVEGIEK